MQQVFKGAGSFDALGSLIKEKDVVVVCTERWKGKLAQLSDRVKFVSPSATLCSLDEVPSLRSNIIVAVGGGSTLDFAKGIIYKGLRRQPPQFIAVPTTAGSGSEATPFAVFYEGKKKISIEDEFLLPGTVILDPSLLTSMPAMQKAVSGADAFCQCIESAWNKNSTAASRAKAFDGMDPIYNYLPGFVKGENSGEEVQIAAYRSGEAIAITRTTGPHALSYYLTAYHGLQHGLAVSLFLPLFFLYNEGALHLKEIYSHLGVSGSEEAMTTTRNFFRSIGLPVNFKEAGVAGPDVEELVGSVDHQRFANNPLPYDRGKLITLIKNYL
jgi:alcohol dehydrogenase